MPFLVILACICSRHVVIILALPHMNAPLMSWSPVQTRSDVSKRSTWQTRDFPIFNNRSLFANGDGNIQFSDKCLNWTERLIPLYHMYPIYSKSDRGIVPHIWPCLRRLVEVNWPTNRSLSSYQQKWTSWTQKAGTTWTCAPADVSLRILGWEWRYLLYLQIFSNCVIKVAKYHSLRKPISKSHEKSSYAFRFCKMPWHTAGNIYSTPETF